MSAIADIVIPAAAGILGALVGAAVGPWVTSRADSRRWREQRQLEVAEHFLSAVTAAETRINWWHATGAGEVPRDQFIALSDSIDTARGALRLYWPEHVTEHATETYFSLSMWALEEAEAGERAHVQMRHDVDAFLAAVGSVIKQVAPAKE